MLIKSSTVLDNKTEYYDDEVVTFYNKDDDTGMVNKIFTMPKDFWEELGSPEVVTITIEPGDKLNE